MNVSQRYNFDIFIPCYNIKSMGLARALVIGIFFSCCFCYLELSLSRSELPHALRNGNIQCITKQIDKQLDAKRKLEKETKNKKKQKKVNQKKDDQNDDDDEDEDSQTEQIDDDKIDEQKNYREICYEKDISYSLPIYLSDSLQMLSIDTTTPISWLKGSNCHLEASQKKCSPVNTNIKDKIKKILHRKQKKVKHNEKDFAIIEGSSELIKGIEEVVQNFEFVTRDSSRLTNLLELLMLGFYMKGEKDQIYLKQTNFINATEISQNLNYLCDGAISLRFDEKSENSFLKQLIAYQKTTDKYVSIFMEKYGVAIISIGEAAWKYSKNGYGGMQWIDIKTDDIYGKLPVISDIIIENQGNHIFSEIRQKQYPAVISLSASYIGIPTQIMNEWLKKFNKKSKCQINNQTKYLECKSFKEKEENKIITFQFSGEKISFELSELRMGVEKGKTIFNIKQTILDKYAVLGEPLFEKYLVVFDYNKDKVGFGQKSDPHANQIINIVSLVRFICFVFFFGCSFILCFLPIKRCVQLLKGKKKETQNRGETRRLKQYSPIQENPYEELSEKVKQVFGENH